MKKYAVFMSILAACCATALVQAQPVPSGPEFQVNTHTTDYQGYPRIAADGSGNFVVVWQSYYQDGDGYGIFGQRFNNQGTPLGSEFPINASTTSWQVFPAVASEDSGNFVVVWESYDQDGDGYGIFARMFDSGGSALGGEFQVNSHTTNWQRFPSVAVDGSGNFVVVWQSYGQDGSQYGIFGQRFDSAGAALGGEFQISTFTTGNQSYPRVAASDAGDFVVVWDSLDQDGSDLGIFGQRFDSAGAALGGEFQINTFTTSRQRVPAVGIDDAGGFVVVWESLGQEGGFGVFGQRFDASGAPAGSEFQVNTYVTGDQRFPAVSMDPNGNFVATWSTGWRDGSGQGIAARGFDDQGLPLGADFQVNTFTTSDQRYPDVALDPDGYFEIVWSSFGQDGEGTGIFGQQFAPPAGCSGPDADGDGACDAGDNCLGLYNPGQEDEDGDGLGNACDVVLTDPAGGSVLDCTNPAISRPVFTWSPGPYDRYRVFLSPDPTFPKGNRVSSGDRLLAITLWSPGKKKWTRACRKAINADPNSPQLYVRVLGVDRDRRKIDPHRKTFSGVVQVWVQR